MAENLYYQVSRTSQELQANSSPDTRGVKNNDDLFEYKLCNETQSKAVITIFNNQSC